MKTKTTSKFWKMKAETAFADNRKIHDALESALSENEKLKKQNCDLIDRLATSRARYGDLYKNSVPLDVHESLKRAFDEQKRNDLNARELRHLSIRASGEVERLRKKRFFFPSAKKIEERTAEINRVDALINKLSDQMATNYNRVLFL